MLHIMKVDLYFEHLFIEGGIIQLEEYLARHAAFEEYCREHDCPNLLRQV